MIPKFRGKTKDGREVFGWLVIDHAIMGAYYIVSENGWFGSLPISEFRNGNIKNNLPPLIKVHPETIAMKTGQTDKNETDIYGSIELDGTMTEGGDRVRMLYTDWMSKDSNDPRTLEQYLKDISHYGDIVFHDDRWSFRTYSEKYKSYNYGSIHCGTHGEIEIIKGE